MKRYTAWSTGFLLLILGVGCVYWQMERSVVQRHIDRSLYAAVEAGDIARVRKLLNQGANPNVREIPVPVPHGLLQYLMFALRRPQHGESGSTALMSAVWDGNEEIAALLMKSGAEVNVEGDSYTALSLAAEGGHSSIVCRLLEGGANPNLPAARPPLWGAVSSQCNGQSVRKLLAHGARFEPTTSEAIDLLVGAARNPDADVIAAFVERGLSVETRDDNGSLLNQACEVGNVAVVRFLLDRGAHLNAKDEQTGYTPLGSALSMKRHIFTRGGSNSDVADLDHVIALLRQRGARD